MFDFALNLTGFLVHGNFPVILTYNVSILECVEVFVIPGRGSYLRLKSEKIYDEANYNVNFYHWRFPVKKIRGTNKNLKKSSRVGQIGQGLGRGKPFRGPRGYPLKPSYNCKKSVGGSMIRL
jgi:hypothetical protein